jgi:F-type H+-transporting ATPase subunit delta
MSVVDRTYARALYDAAREAGRLPAARQDLGDFVEAARLVPELGEILRNPQLDKRAKTAAVEAVAGDAEPFVLNFLRLLVDKGRAGDLDRIAEEFERLAAADEGELPIELTTAVELTDEEAQSILAQIEQRSGRKVEATRTVDPALIGGFVLQAGSRRVDASVRGRIEQLGRELRTRA